MLFTTIILIVLLALVIEWDCQPIRRTYWYLKGRKSVTIFRYGSRVQITGGTFRGLHGKISDKRKSGDAWQVRIETGDSRFAYAYKYLPERHLRLIESSYSIWIDDGFVSERYSSGYETEVQAARICTTLQQKYTSLYYKTCKFTVKLRNS